MYAIRPVLKHGPRSLALLRVEGCGKPIGGVKAKNEKLEQIEEVLRR